MASGHVSWPQMLLCSEISVIFSVVGTGCFAVSMSKGKPVFVQHKILNAEEPQLAACECVLGETGHS